MSEAMEAVFHLWHCHDVDGSDEEKFIGVYKTRADAEAAIERLKDKPGSRDTVDGFEIHDHVVGRDGWTEGYCSWQSATWHSDSSQTDQKLEEGAELKSTIGGDAILDRLAGKRMWTARRAANMATFQFGGRRHVRTFHGHDAEVGEFSLHVQCAWRIVRGDQTVVASGDLYYPADYSDGDAIPQSFDWDRKPNRRDQLLRGLFRDGTVSFTARHVSLDAAGSCRIEFEEDLCLEIVPVDSLSHEHWRLFATDESDRVCLIK
jgi:hypothetical protein